MKILKSYRLFEQEEEKRPDLVDQVLKFLPKVAMDRFTREIIPSIKRLINTDSADEKKASYQSIRDIAKHHFAGFDKLITMQEVMERFVNHYIGDEGIIRKRGVKKLIRNIKPPVKKSLKADKNYRIKAVDIDSFTKKILTLLEREGIKEADIKTELKRIYEWLEPVFRHFYHLDTIKSLKYMQPGVLFNQHELNIYYGEPEVPKEAPVLNPDEE